MNPLMQSNLRALRLLLTDAAISAAVGGVAGYLAPWFLPCDWFGSTDEGACSFGVLFASLGVAAGLAAVVFLILAFKTLRREYGPVLAAATFSPKRVLGARAWLALFAVQWLAYGAMLRWPGALGGIAYEVLWISQMGLMVVSIVLLWWLRVPLVIGLLFLIPIVGLLFMPIVLVRDVVRLAVERS